MPETAIHPETRLGPVHLAVSDLERAVRFYTQSLGLHLLHREGGEAAVGAPDEAVLLRLEELPGARARSSRTTGLYHFALLVPTRKDLARTLAHLGEVRYPLQGASDHLVSEAIYLADPDGNGVEIYADRPREVWPLHDGQVQMATNPLELDGLLAELEGDDSPWEGLPAGTRVGHIHLQVADLRRAEAFYRQILGFDLVQRYGPSAVFLSAGGYHHHVGLNTWAGAGAPHPPSDAVGLRFFTLCLPEAAELHRVAERARGGGLAFEERAEGLFLRDPSGNGVLLSAECGIV